MALHHTIQVVNFNTINKHVIIIYFYCTTWEQLLAFSHFVCVSEMADSHGFKDSDQKYVYTRTTKAAMTFTRHLTASFVTFP
jgi:predicted NAD-dependent protein-ADP-ribosyltransferase YbiA (DUF1768 family)